MIHFEQANAILAHLNVRDEKHGEEIVVACDIKLKIDMPNKALEMLSPGLALSLYKGEDAQNELFADGHLPHLRHPTMGSPKFEFEPTKVELYFHRVTHDIKVEGLVKKIAVDCKEGGTVTFTFTVACRPDSDDIGRLSGMLGSDHETSLRLVQEDDGDPGDGDTKDGEK